MCLKAQAGFAFRRWNHFAARQKLSLVFETQQSFWHKRLPLRISLGELVAVSDAGVLKKRGLRFLGLHLHHFRVGSRGYAHSLKGTSIWKTRPVWVAFKADCGLTWWLALIPYSHIAVGVKRLHKPCAVLAYPTLNPLRCLLFFKRVFEWSMHAGHGDRGTL